MCVLIISFITNTLNETIPQVLDELNQRISLDQKARNWSEFKTIQDAYRRSSDYVSKSVMKDVPTLLRDLIADSMHAEALELLRLNGNNSSRNEFKELASDVHRL